MRPKFNHYLIPAFTLVFLFLCQISCKKKTANTTPPSSFTVKSEKVTIYESRDCDIDENGLLDFSVLIFSEPDSTSSMWIMTLNGFELGSTVVNDTLYSSTEVSIPDPGKKEKVYTRTYTCTRRSQNDTVLYAYVSAHLICRSNLNFRLLTNSTSFYGGKFTLYYNESRTLRSSDVRNDTTYRLVDAYKQDCRSIPPVGQPFYLVFRNKFFPERTGWLKLLIKERGRALEIQEVVYSK